MARHTRLRQPQAKPRNGTVQIARPGVDILHPLVRRKALELAKGDALRVEVVNRETAIVRN